MEAAGPAIVTGSHGFVGSVLVRSLPGHVALSLGAPDWRPRLAAADFRNATVFHVAARVHARGDADEAFLRDNVEKTEALALAAARGGARRFVFTSTVKVHGDETHGVPLRSDAALAPGDAYARSKRLAEESLARIARETGLAVAIVRPPLVVGRGAKANLADLLRLADTPWPLPFAAIHNRRSWVHVEDLCDLLRLCAGSAAAPGQAWLASHPEPFSTAGLFAQLRRALDRPPRLFACPPAVLERLAVGRRMGERMQRLTRSLEADASATMGTLGWQPRRSLAEALAGLVRGSAP